MTQILHGTGQPTNAYLPDTPANYYWLYHALVASVSDVFRLPHPFAAAILNMVALASVIGWAHRTIRHLLPTRYSPVVQSMAVIFAIFGMNLFGSIQSMADMWIEFRIWRILEVLSPASLSEPRLNTLADKIFNYNSTPLALIFVWMAMYVGLRLAQRKATPTDWAFLSISVAGGTIFLLIFGIVMALTVSGALFLVWLLHLVRRTDAFAWRDLLPRITLSRDWLLFAGSALCSVILLFYALAALTALSDASTAGHSIGITIESFNNAMVIIGATYALGIFVIIGMVYCWYTDDAVAMYLLFGFLIMIFGALAIESSEYYKFILFGTSFATLLTVYLLPKLTLSIAESKPAVRVTIPVLMLLFAFVAINIITFSGGQLPVQAREWQPRAYAYDGVAVISNTSPFKDVYDWLRADDTDYDVLIMPPDETTYTPILSDSIPYVSDVYYSTGLSSLPAWQDRLDALYPLMSESLDSEAWQEAWALLQTQLGERTAIYLFPNDSPADTESLEAFGFETLFVGENASLYRFPR